LSHQRLAIVAEWFDRQILPHRRQVFASGLGDIVLPQILPIIGFAHASGNMFGNGIRYLLGGYKKAQPLIGF